MRGDEVLENVVLEVKSGSHLYGTNTPESDRDYMGIFMPPEEYVFGLKTVKEVDCSIKSKDKSGRNDKDAVDVKLYEFRHFVKLALANNPNILEVLFVGEDAIVSCTETGRELLKNRHLFPSRQSHKRFSAYARGQRHKMIMRGEHRESLLEAESVLSELIDHGNDKMVMAELSLEKGPFGRVKNHIQVGDLLIEPGVYVKKAYKMVKHRLDNATSRSTLMDKYGYDTKFASHLIRLLLENNRMLKTSELVFPLPEEERQTVLDIKLGKWDMEKVVKYSEELEAESDSLVLSSSLPANARYQDVESMVIRMMREHLL